MNKNISLDALLEKELQDSTFKLEFEKENNYLSIAVAIHQARTELNWNKVELSKRSGVPVSTISKIENGNNVSLDTLTKLTSAMDKTLIIEVN